MNTKNKQCKICGNSEIIISDGFVICNSCGSKYASGEIVKIKKQSSITEECENSKGKPNKKRVFNKRNALVATFTIIILVAVALIIAVSQSSIIRGVKWGESFNDVLKKEQANGNFECSIHDNFFVVDFDDNIELFNLPVNEIFYSFTNDKLTQIIVSYYEYDKDIPRDEEKERQRIFNTLVETLEKEYGKASEVKYYSGNEDVMYATWVKDDFQIKLNNETLYGNQFEIRYIHNDHK